MVDDVTNKREGTFITCLNFYIYIKLVHSMPSNSGGRKSSSGRRLEIIAALPRIRWRDIFWISWPIVSLSSEPVCLASAEPRRFSWLMARRCMPPSVSKAMGRKTSPCCRQALAVSCIFGSLALPKAPPSWHPSPNVSSQSRIFGP